jgi:hypothetical protein
VNGRIRLGLLGNDGLVHGEDIGDTRIEDLCAEGIAGGESTEADNEVRRSVLEVVTARRCRVERESRVLEILR